MAQDTYTLTISDTGSSANFSGNLVGDVTGTQGATAISAATVTGKLLTGYISGAGTVLATDSILGAINKLNGNVALKAPLASPTFTGTVTASTFAGNATTATSATNFSGSLVGDVTGTQGATSIAASTVTGKALTGYVSGAGTIATTDTILSAINKLNGNVALKANLASPTFTGTVVIPAGTIPASASATGVAGQLAWDATHLYICVATNTWTRVTLAW